MSDLDALNRALAEAQGYGAKRYTSKWGTPCWCVIGPVKGQKYRRTIDNAFVDDGTDFEWWRTVMVPDWARDPSAALALCLEIAEPHRWMVATRKGYKYAIKEHEAMMLRTIYEDDEPFERCLVVRMAVIYAEEGTTPAEALARLALAALTAQEATDA